MIFFFRLSEFFFYPLLARRCWAAIPLSHRPEPSGRGGSMDWTVEDDMDDGLFCTTLTGRRGGHTPFVQAGEETSDTGAEAVEPDPGSSWESHSGGVCTVVWNWSAESCGVVRPLAFHWWSTHCTARMLLSEKTDELLCGGYKWVSRFEAPCICTRWTGERWVEQVSRLHGTAS